MKARPLIDYARRGLRLDFPVFDVHAHIHPLGSVGDLSLEWQVAQMDRIGIRMAALNSTLALAGQFSQGNDEVAAAIRRYPDRFVGYCHVSANYPDLMLPELERCFAQPGFRAIKVYQVGTPYDHPLFDPVWEFARAHRAPILAHTWGGELTGFDRAAERFPEVAFMAAHAGSSFVAEPYIQAAKRLPNFYPDLTYSREHTDQIEQLVEQVGPDRLVWGTDVICFSMAAGVGKILFARIPDAAKRTLLHDTAARLFGLT